MFPSFDLETEARLEGFKKLAGGDEAGRGCWAGPVCAAFVILPHSFDLSGLNDSKKLSRAQRHTQFSRIKDGALSYGIGFSTEKEIDKINILEATRLAFMRAFEALALKPDFVLLDFIHLPMLPVRSASYVRGDQKSASIAAASILAKESRDLLMERIDQKYPGYGFSHHKGYGTLKHRLALKELGPCAIHRMSYKPVKNVVQPSLF